MLDRFDRQLLEAVQRDDGRTADALAEEIPLSPSALARRLRRLREQGWIARTIAVLSDRITRDRLRAVVLIQLAEHADKAGKAELERRLIEADAVQFCFEISGPHDLVALFDCSNTTDFTDSAEALLATSPTVRRYEAHFVKREVKFAPFVCLT